MEILILFFLYIKTFNKKYNTDGYITTLINEAALVSIVIGYRFKCQNHIFLEVLPMQDRMNVFAAYLNIFSLNNVSHGKILLPSHTKQSKILKNISFEILRNVIKIIIIFYLSY